MSHTQGMSPRQLALAVAGAVALAACGHAQAPPPSKATQAVPATPRSTPDLQRLAPSDLIR